ncbi:MAG: glycosyltransferase [Rhodoglobus sp.]
MVPRIAVLLATYNGRTWLADQVDSILNQTDVDVHIIALDDGSTDGTVEWLAEQAEREPRLTVLPTDSASGSSAANFFRLVERADVTDADYVAFADQDDLWRPRKLVSQVAQLHDRSASGVSSSVMSFTPDGTQTLIRKDFPQREFDYLTESPGPGCSFLMTQELVEIIRSVLATEPLARAADFHDSLIYVIARAAGLTWHIDGEPTVDYRQHDGNVLGANVGASSALARLTLIREHWHRNQAIVHAKVGLSVASDNTRPGLTRMLTLLESRSVRDRWALARRATQMRRRPRDRRIIGLLIATGIW